MLDRRRFTFGSLVALVSQTAAAEVPEVAQQATGELSASWAVKRKGGELHATLTVHNGRSTPLDLMVARGSMPGPDVRARVGEVELSQILSDIDRRDLMSRIGPRPRFEAIAAGRSLEVATYKFQLADVEADAVELSVSIVAGPEWIELPTQRVPLGKRPES